MATTTLPGAKRWRLSCAPKACGDSSMAKRRAPAHQPRSRTGLLESWCSIWCRINEFTFGLNRTTPLPLGRPWRHSMCSRKLALASSLMTSSLPSENALRCPYQPSALELSRPWPGFSSCAPPPSLWRLRMTNWAVWQWCTIWATNTSISARRLQALLTDLDMDKVKVAFQTEEMNRRPRPDPSASSALSASTSTCRCNSSSPCAFCVTKLDTANASATHCNAPKIISSCRRALGGGPTRPMPPLLLQQAHWRRRQHRYCQCDLSGRGRTHWKCKSPFNWSLWSLLASPTRCWRRLECRHGGHFSYDASSSLAAQLNSQTRPHQACRYSEQQNRSNN